MTKSNKKITINLGFIIGIVVIIILATTLIVANLPEPKEEKLEGRSSGEQDTSTEMVIFSGTHSIASWSANGSEDHIVYESDASDVDSNASLSVGDVVSFDNRAGELPNPLGYDVHYYVISVSYGDTDYEDRFEVSSTSDGSNLGTIASSSAGDLVYEEFAETGEMDVSQYEYIGFSITAEITPSLGFDWLCSLQDEAPDWYATRSTTNQWSYADAYDIRTGTSIDGDVGIANLNGIAEVSTYQVFANTCKWFFVRSSNHASGSTNVIGVGY